MSNEGYYSERDLDAAYDEGRRAATRATQPRPGLGIANVIAIIAIIIMVGIMVLTYIGVEPSVRPVETPDAAPAVVAPRPAAAPQPAPAVIIQSVPQDAAPQQITIPPPAPVVPPPDTNTVDNVAPQPAPAPIVIVSHEGYQQPVITGSGACKVAALGARRCAK